MDMLSQLLLRSGKFIPSFTFLLHPPLLITIFTSES